MKKLVIVFAMLMLVGCAKKEDAQSIDMRASTTLSIDEAIDAVLRAHPNSLQDCYDSSLNAHLLDYGPPLRRGEQDDGYYHGWMLLENVSYHQTQNKIWFITDQPEHNYTHVYPVIDGLPCKAH